MLYSLVYIKEKRSHPFLFGKLNGFWMVVLQHIRNFSQKSASAIFCHIREDRPTESSALQHLQPCYNSAGYQRRGVEGNHWFKSKKRLGQINRDSNNAVKTTKTRNKGHKLSSTCRQSCYSRRMAEILRREFSVKMLLALHTFNT